MIPELVEAEVQVIAALAEKKESAWRVKVVAALQETALDTVIDPLLGPEPPDPIVEIVTLQDANCV